MPNSNRGYHTVDIEFPKDRPYYGHIAWGELQRRAEEAKVPHYAQMKWQHVKKSFWTGNERSYIKVTFWWTEFGD